MKKLHNFLIKAFSMCLAFILVFPTNLFAMGLDNTKNYTATASVMGLAENNDSGKDNTDQTLLASDVTSTDTGKYIIEKSAKLSKTTGKVDFMIKVFAKVNSTEDKLTTSFAISENTDLKDLKVEKVSRIDKTEEEIKYQEQRPSILQANHAFETLGVTTEKTDLVYYLSAQLTDEALADIEDKSPTMALNFNIGADTQESYGLSIEKMEELGEAGQEPSQILKEDQDNQIKAIYKEKTSSLLGEKPAEITWTDFINPKDDKEFIYDIKVDDSQDTSKSEIKIEFYEASEKGFVIKDEFTKTLPFANSLKLQVPNGHIAKVEFKSSIKEDTNPKTFSLNNKEIKNPNYKEETSQTDKNKSEETNADNEEDPLPADSSKGEKTSSKADKEQAEKGNQAENAKESSAITLNKEAYLAKAKEEEKLTSQIQKATNQIAFILDSYNKDEINWDEFKSSIKTIAKAQELESNQTEEILSALIAGLEEDKYKVAKIDIKDATNFEKTDESNNENAPATEEGAKLSVYEIKTLIKEEFAKKNSGQITEEELEQSLEQIRDENNIDKETFFNILADLYKNEEITSKDLENSSKSEELPAIDTEKSKEEVLAEKLAEENLSTEDFIRFLQSYVKRYELEENDLKAMLMENQDEVEKLIGEFTIDEILAAAYHEGLNPQILAADDNANITDAGISNERFITELEYSTETLTRATNEDKLFEIAKTYPPDSTNSSEQVIRNNYVGWKINIPGVDESGITEIKKDKYVYKNMNFSVYAPAGQSLEGYKVVVEDGEGGKTAYSGDMKEIIGDHYIYSFSIPKDQLKAKEGYNIYVVAKAPKKRQNYAIGLKIEPDNNYVLTLRDKFNQDFEKFSKENPFLIKWKDTSDANPYANGIELLDTRMVYLEPKGWQDLFPYNGFKSIDYNDNVTDTDLMKNRVSMFGNIDKNGQITWTISETFPAEKLVNKNTVGIDAYSAKTDSGNLGNPSVQVLVPDGAGYKVAYTGNNVDIATLQSKIGNQPGTIVNYTFKEQAKDKDKLTTLSLDSGRSASIAYKPNLLQREEGAEKDTTGLEYLHKVQEHNNGSGYEIALSNDQAHTMKAFIPKDTSADPRYKDKNFVDTGVIVFCLNPGKPEPTRQYKFNGTITKGEWKTDKGSWEQNGRALAALATANEAKASPLYKMNGSKVDGNFYKSLYEYILRMYWYGQELAEEYQLDEQSYYKIIQYNLYYWLAGENYAESFRNGGGYNTGYFSSAEYSYAQGLKKRIEAKKDWDKVNYDEDIQIFYYGHDKTRSYQNTITGDTKRNKDKGSITVNKTDQDGNKLQGAYFQLLKDDQKTVIKTLITDENGVALFDDLDYGTYYIKEVQGPKGYQFKEEISDAIVVGEKQAHHTFNYKNKKNEIVFRKVNENGRAMSDVVFELRRNGRALEGQDQTSGNKAGNKGKFGWKELTPGYYEVVEKDISIYPEYSENQGRTVASFRVDENNKIQDKKIYYRNGSSKDDIKNEKNEGKPIGIEFTKIDANTGTPLEGAEFVLEYRKPGSSIFRELPGSKRISTSDGKLVWNELVDGDYRVIETKAPDDDKYDTELNLGEKATFTIEKNQNGYYEITKKTPTDLIITNTEKPEEPKTTTGEFEFTKEDKETKEKLQGVEFTLTSDGEVGEKGKEFDYKVSKTTDENGKIKFETLYPGTYTLKETRQLPGYYKEDTRFWTVKVDEKGNTQVFDQDGKALSSAVDKLIFEDNNNVVSNNAKYKFSLEETDQENFVDLKVTIEPQATTNEANIYYVYDDDSNKNKINDLVFEKNVHKIIPIKVNNKEEYKNHIQKANLSHGLRSDDNGILVSYITKDYANQLSKNEINVMVTGKNDDVNGKNKPLFAYYKNNSTNLETIYNQRTEDSHGFYKVDQNPDFKELIDFVNSGALGSSDKNITLQYSDNSAIAVEDDISTNSFNTFFRNGNYLIPGKPTTITKKIKVDSEKVKNSYRSELAVFDQVTIRPFSGSDVVEYGANLPRIKVGESSDSSTLTIGNEKEKPKPANLTIRKYDSGSNEGLAGAEFELFKYYVDALNRDNVITEATTNDKGFAKFKDSSKIVAGEWYFVREVKAPEGYQIADNPISQVKASLEANNEIDLEIPNDKNHARFELYKKDSEGNYLSGAKFRLLDQNQEPYDPDIVDTTDSNGYIKFDNLEAGNIYYLEEVEAPEGYLKNPTKLKLEVEADGNIKWEKNDLIQEEYTEPEYITKQRPLDKWRAFEDNVLSDDPSYLNTREYAELVNPETGELHYYVMLKAQDFEGNGTNVATEFIASTENADIKKIELFEAESYPTDVKERIAKDMKEGTIAENKDLFLANAPNTNAGDITMEASGVSARTTNSLEFENSANEVTIRFPNGRFDGNWAYVVKVTANVKDSSKNTKLIYRWQNSVGEGKYLTNYQEMPPLKAEVKVRQSDTSRFTVINEKRPSINFVKEDVASGVKLYGAEFVLYKDGKEVTNSLTSSDKEGNFGFDNLEDGSYTVYETVSPEGYPYLKKKLEVASFTVKDGKVTNLKTNQKYGEEIIENFDSNEAYPIYNKVNEIKFKKVGKDNKPLAGAKFKLDRVWDSYDDKGDLKANRETVLKDNIETLEDGIIALSATEPGRYQLIETSAPEGYQQVNTDNDEKGEIVAEFTVERGSLDIKNVLVGNTYIQDMKNDTGDLEIVNKKEGKGKFQVNKVEKDGTTTKPLTGARFLLRDIDSDQYVNTDGTLTTNSGSALTNGNATVDYENLPVGEYELREFKSPDGYVRTINTWKVVVARYGKTTITKNEELDNDVDADIDNKDTSSPKLTLVNKSNEIEFTKVDSKTNDPIIGVQFEVWWDQQGNIENRYEDTEESQYKNYVKIENPDGGTKFTTDSKGKFKLSNLGTGHYKIYETLPKDYKVTDQLTDNEPIAKATGEFVNEFYVDIDGYIKKYDNGIVAGKDEEPITTIKNTPITGKFRVQKVGENGVEKLEGAEFELYKLGENGEADKTDPISPTQVKDSNKEDITGLVEFDDLEAGQYLLEETKAPKGYVMTTTKWKVTVSIDGKVNISSTDESSSFTRTDDTLTLNVVNKKPTYPSTGGTGVKIAFALIGTAVMITALAYFGILNTSKTRRR